jgi:hypothetical protein
VADVAAGARLNVKSDVEASVASAALSASDLGVGLDVNVNALVAMGVALGLTLMAGIVMVGHLYFLKPFYFSIFWKNYNESPFI